jgi:hypothetical protein
VATSANKPPQTDRPRWTTPKHERPRKRPQTTFTADRELPLISVSMQTATEQPLGDALHGSAPGRTDHNVE